MDEIDDSCLTNSEITQTERETTRAFNLLYSYNFVDFDAFDEPLKRRFSVIEIGNIRAVNRHMNLPLSIGSISLDDNLFSPFQSEDAEQDYLFVSKTDVSSSAFVINDKIMDKRVYANSSYYSMKLTLHWM